MKKPLPLLLFISTAFASSCVGARASLLPTTSSAGYDGYSTMRVYEITADDVSKKPITIRFDMEYKRNNGEPIADREERNRIETLLSPDLSKLKGDGYYYIHSLYYDMECTRFVNFDDIATCDLNLFYYITG